MAQDNRNSPPPRGGKPGDGRRDGRDGNRGGPNRGGPGRGGQGRGGPGREPSRADTYETVGELTRGDGFRIDKYVLADKSTHKPVRTEYRLTRDGVSGTQVFSRLFEAQTAATAPLPEPESPPEPEALPEVESAPDAASEAEAPEAEAEPGASGEAEH